jgi:hypothetical protein
MDHLVIQSNTPSLEAEEAVLSGAVVASAQPGYVGTGYADYINASGDYIEWTANASSTGSYSLKFRYANGGTTNRPLQLKINGVVINANLAFLPTGGWATWSISSATVNLIAGNNKIRLTTIGANGPNVDNVSFTIANSSTLAVQKFAIEKAPLKTADFLKAYIAPNPVVNNAKLVVSTSSTLPIDFELFDVLGRTYKFLKLIPGASNTYNFSVNDLLPGPYVIILNQGNLSTHVRLIVAKNKM